MLKYLDYIFVRISEIKQTFGFFRIWEERQRKAKRSAAATATALAALKEKHSQQVQYIQNLYEPFVVGEIDRAEYLALKAAAVRKRDDTAEQIAKMEASLENWSADGTLRNRFVDKFKQYTEVQMLTGEIVSDVLDSVCIYPGGQVEIIWNFCDELDRLLLDLKGGIENGE